MRNLQLALAACLLLAAPARAQVTPVATQLFPSAPAFWAPAFERLGTWLGTPEGLALRGVDAALLEGISKLDFTQDRALRAVAPLAARLNPRQALKLAAIGELDGAEQLKVLEELSLAKTAALGDVDAAVARETARAGQTAFTGVSKLSDLEALSDELGALSIYGPAVAAAQQSVAALVAELKGDAAVARAKEQAERLTGEDAAEDGKPRKAIGFGREDEAPAAMDGQVTREIGFTSDEDLGPVDERPASGKPIGFATEEAPAKVEAQAPRKSVEAFVTKREGNVTFADFQAQARTRPVRADEAIGIAGKAASPAIRNLHVEMKRNLRNYQIVASMDGAKPAVVSDYRAKSRVLEQRIRLLEWNVNGLGEDIDLSAHKGWVRETHEPRGYAYEFDERTGAPIGLPEGHPLRSYYERGMARSQGLGGLWDGIRGLSLDGKVFTVMIGGLAGIIAVGLTKAILPGAAAAVVVTTALLIFFGTRNRGPRLPFR